MVRWYAWLDEKIAHGFEIDEYQAGQRLTEFRRRSELYVDLAYENISACGPNAGERLSMCGFLFLFCKLTCCCSASTLHGSPSYCVASTITIVSSESVWFISRS
jgi:hypothetical protein